MTKHLYEQVWHFLRPIILPIIGLLITIFELPFKLPLLLLLPRWRHDLETDSDYDYVWPRLNVLKVYLRKNTKKQLFACLIDWQMFKWKPGCWSLYVMNTMRINTCFHTVELVLPIISIFRRIKRGIYTSVYQTNSIVIQIPSYGGINFIRTARRIPDIYCIKSSKCNAWIWHYEQGWDL